MSTSPGTLSSNLDVLLKNYEDQLKTVKRLMKIKNIKDSIEDVILIRYILSYGDKLEEAVNSIEKAVMWRKKNVYPLLKNREIYSGDDDLVLPDRVKPYYSFIKKALAACEHKSTIDKQPVVIARLKLCNFTLLLDNVPENILIDYIVYSNEHEFIVCNEQTKRNNMLCRTFRFIDLKGFMLKKFDRRFLRVFANTSKLSEFLHPQLVGKTYLINAPSYIRITIETLKAFGISKRTLNKLEIPKVVPSKEPADCDWFSLLVHKDDIPTYLGGNCKCENGCIPGFENDLENPLNFNTEEIKAEIKNNIKKLKMRKKENRKGSENHYKK
ncbi:sec14-like cytosolic factor or phosphatidylinositol/phosphatidylcholine transfer protein, putative [Plasmodium relictum]|uniref:Sec14-like cytosolic factor or phosphatidylinositol/phosphatidylcholine transfer protein, putative n=1 Tax=Plasmodium relictum TaxID=85471 RepID=A0A1J1H8F3_PLARL|nr:sec14-like cytosolic factor or phosphatidylinositol/phosphatidylcholine transfer protein, putative [Plasmodium relictum]CRH00838.1 sec14-like cytosolic factor or phosphatidylinositol/phosphatidylcholine transfer protein, putative [Plasmodium relictum]